LTVRFDASHATMSEICLSVSGCAGVDEGNLNAIGLAAVGEAGDRDTAQVLVTDQRE